MNANDYQTQAARTLIAAPDNTYSGDEIMLVWNALGLAGEAGDCLWYVAALCSTLGVPMSEVMGRNIAKLRIRFPDGWSTAASIARDVAREGCGR